MQISKQSFEVVAFVLGCIGTVCLAVCFWWMRRISSRQDAMLEELHEMTTRIERLSQAEHDGGTILIVMMDSFTDKAATL